MLNLPALSITRDELVEVTLLNKMRYWLNEQDKERQEGIHASDLLDVRKAYWNRASPKELTEREVGLFVVGKVLHSFVLTSAGGEHGASDSGTQNALGILFSPDHHEDGRPIELKTNRSPLEPNPEKLQEDLYVYLEQLCIYLVLMNQLAGELWVLYLNLKNTSGQTCPEMRCYRVSMAEEQFYALETEILRARDRLEHAWSTKQPELLEPCRAWKCGHDRCPHWNECQPQGRWPNKTRKKWDQ